MILKNNTAMIKGERFLRRLAKAAWHDHRLIFFSTMLGVGCFLCFLWGMAAFENGDFGRIVVPVLKSNIAIPINFCKSLPYKTDYIELDLKHVNYMKLAYKRSQALEEGILHPLPEDWVSGHIRWNKKDVRVDVRLKGNYGDNWAYTHKWAFQIKVKDNQTIMGMSKFTLKHPRTRGFLTDWIFFKMLRYAGNNLTVRHQFARCAINGRDLGIYLVEEQFSKELIEANNRPPSSLIKIWNRWQYYNADTTGGFSNEVLNEQYTISPPYPFRANTQMKNDTVFADFIKAKNLYEAFKRKRIKTHQAFDVKKLAVQFAMGDLFGYHHASAYANMGLYYNPETNLIEPVGYDEGEVYPIKRIIGDKKTKVPGQSPELTYGYAPHCRQFWFDAFFEDTVFYIAYVNELKKVSQKEFLDSFFLSIDSAYNKNLLAIHKTYPGYRFEDRQTLFDNQEFIRKALDPDQGCRPSLAP
jgi:hypothetical protein